MTQLQSPGQAPPPPVNKTVQQHLDEVTNELNRIEAQKLAELKTELEAFVKKQLDVVADYEKQFPVLRAKWCSQNLVVQNLHASLHDVLSIADWQKCVCDVRTAITKGERRIAKRQRCCKGKLERERDDAKSAFEWDKDQLEILKALTQKVGAKLSDADKLIKEIQTAITADKWLAAYLFFFKLWPAHRDVQPDDLDQACKDFFKTAATHQCDTSKIDGTEDGGCKTPAEAAGKAEDYAARETELAARKKLPRLLVPKSYKAELDKAFDSYLVSKKAFADKESDYKAAPDDLASLIKLLDKARADQDVSIKACFKTHNTEECCPSHKVPGKPPGVTPPAVPPPAVPPYQGAPPADYTPHTATKTAE
jgi:hypothetical protein